MKQTNFELYTKMMDAGSRRADALYAEEDMDIKPKETAKQNEKNPAVVEEKKSDPIPIIHRGSRFRKGKFRKAAFAAVAKTIVKEDVVPEKKEEPVDAAELAIKWACKVLLKEHNKRSEARARRRSLKKKARKKIQSIWAFHKMTETKKKSKVNKKEGEEKRKLEEFLMKEEQRIIGDDKGAVGGSMMNDQRDEDEDNGEPTKRRVIIVNLQKRLNSLKRKPSTKKKERIDTFSSRIQDGKLTTEKEKMEAAKQHLKWLEEQQKNRANVNSLGMTIMKADPALGDTEMTIQELQTLRFREEISKIQSLERTASQKGKVLVFRNSISILLRQPNV